MNAPTLFDVDAPRARRSDPAPAHHAARKVKQSNEKLRKSIREAATALGSATSWQIAAKVQEQYGDLWQEDSIRTGCARAGLVRQSGGVSPRGNPATLYSCPWGAVPVGAIL